MAPIGPSFRGTRQREPGISRFSDAQLHIVVRCGACHRAGQRPDPLASPRNDGQTRLISSLSSTGFGKPSRATLIMARPSCSLVVMYFGATRLSQDNSGAATT